MTAFDVKEFCSIPYQFICFGFKPIKLMRKCPWSCNDLAECSKVNVIMYADESVLTCARKSSSEMQEFMNKELNNISSSADTQELT